MLEKKPQLKVQNTGKDALPEVLANSAIHRKYHLGAVLNRDFAGTLYSVAHMVQEGREMAVKVLSPGYASSGNTLGSIDHSRICKIRNIIIERDTIRAVVHEKPLGKSLTAHIKASGPLPPGEAVLAALQLLSAVHAVHWHGAVVGNLHADSVFLSRDKGGNLEVQLANLGVVCTDDTIREQDYLAPEQIMGGASATVRSDIWAAGAILYEMLMGRRPFVGENRYETAGEILLQELRFKGHNPKIPESLLDVVRRAMDKDERNRYDAVSDMVADLMPFQTDFNEPMSDAAKTAIHDSVPPSKKDDAGQVARKVKPRPGARAIPTVRISHTPSYPPAKASTAKENNVETAERVRPVMKTQLGMPAISLPPKRIPLKTKEDTSTFVTPRPEPPLDLSAYTARKKRGDATETPSSPAHVRSDEIAPPTTAFLAVASRFNVVRNAASGLLTFVVTKAKTASAREKKIALAAGCALIALIAVTLVFSGGEDEKPSARPSKTSIATVAPKAPDVPAPASTQETAESQSTRESTAVAAQEVSKVEITIKGRLPKRAVIQAGGAEMDGRKFSVEAGEAPVEILVTADGYEDFVTEIVPSKPQTLKVTMHRLRGKSLRSYKARRAKSQKKEKSDKGLASNPFGG